MTHPATIPTITPWLLRGFVGYVDRFVRRHFDRVRVLKGHGPSVCEGASLLIVLNHASWWDPMACWFWDGKHAAFEGRRHHAPIDAAMLEKYGVFKRLGFFGVEQDTREGAVAFLKTGEAILRDPGRTLWVTAQGRFADVRDRPVVLRPGVAHLCRRMQREDIPVRVMALAIEYPFWDERTPELLMAFSGAIDPAALPMLDVEGWQALLTQRLTGAMDALRDAAVSRDASRFDVLGEGRRGIGGLYDTARRAKAWWRGERFEKGHTGE